MSTNHNKCEKLVHYTSLYLHPAIVSFNHQVYLFNATLKHYLSLLLHFNVFTSQENSNLKNKQEKMLKLQEKNFLFYTVNRQLLCIYSSLASKVL